MTAPLAHVQADFDEIAPLAESGGSGTDRYDGFLLSQVPATARRVLDLGCGLGRLTWALAATDRDVLGIDLSQAMIARATRAGTAARVSYRQGDVLALDFSGARFDCIVSAATLHHLDAAVALPRIVDLLEPGGRLILQDLRRDASVGDVLRAWTAFGQVMLRRFLRTGSPRQPRLVREAWARHGAHERYLSLDEARAMAARYLPGSIVTNHWMWRYTIVWDKPVAR